MARWGEIARTVGALLALGVVAVLRTPLAVLPILVVMVVVATFMVTARLTGIAVRDHWRRSAVVDVAVVRGAGVVGSIVFRVGALVFDVRNLVAYGGITIGGAMTGSTLTTLPNAALDSELCERSVARGDAGVSEAQLGVVDQVADDGGVVIRCQRSVKGAGVVGASGLRQLGIGVAAAAVTSGLGRLFGTVVG